MQAVVRAQKDFSARIQVWCCDVVELLMALASEVRSHVAINVFNGETLNMAET
jgi:hypothetical protein